MFIKKCAMSLTALCCAISLTACSSGIAISVPTEYNASTNKTRISMAWWGNDTRHKYTLEGISEFENDNPEIEVRHRYGVWNGYEKRQQVMMRAHTDADVMQINFAWISKYSPDGTGFYDLAKLREVIDLGSYTAEDLELGTVNGHLNALPISYNASTFWFNRTIYEEAGIAIPETWDDLFAAAEAMKGMDVYPIGMEKKHLFLMLSAWYAQTSGNEVFAEDGSFAAGAEGIAAMLTFYQELVDKGVMAPVGQYSSNDFEARRCAGILCWISDSSRYCQPLDAGGFGVELGKPLTDPNAKLFGWYVKPSTLYAISSITEHPEEAGRLLDYLVNDTTMALLQGTEKGIPVSAKAREALEEADLLTGYENTATEQMTAMRSSYETMVPQMENADIIDAFKDESDRLLYGQAELDECTDAIVEAIEEALK